MQSKVQTLSFKMLARVSESDEETNRGWRIRCAIYMNRKHTHSYGSVGSVGVSMIDTGIIDRYTGIAWHDSPKAGPSVSIEMSKGLSLFVREPRMVQRRNVG